MKRAKYTRPTWDEYFMEIAATVSQRATCDRGRSGCVIARDKQICHRVRWLPQGIASLRRRRAFNEEGAA